jgi:thymidylate synthase (FAD)
MKVELIAHTPEAEKIIAAAGKLCYSDSDIESLMNGIDKQTEDYYVGMLMGMGHESTIEHANYTFAIEGVSRAVLAQITRHRIASFSVQSQRYVNLSDFKYITPPSVAANPEALKEYEELINSAKEKYNIISGHLLKDNFRRICGEKTKLSADEIDQAFDSLTAKTCEDKELKSCFTQAKKMSNEDARFVLPNACETKILMTMNARSLYNFFKLRTCMRAQWEIRALAEEMLKKLKEVSPVLFKKAGPPCVCSGHCPEGKMSCGKMQEIRRKFGVE